jgi:hypothetical protein
MSKRLNKAPKADLRLIAIDWSGRIDAAGQRRHIWSAIWTRSESGIKVQLEAGRWPVRRRAWS